MNIEIKKRSKAERLVTAGSLLASIYSELLSGDTDDAHNLLQLATMVQVDINRIVWWLNDKNNKHTDHDKRCLQAETHDISTNTHECVKDTHDKTSPNCSGKPNNSDEPQERSCDNCNQRHCFVCIAHRYYRYYWEPKDEPQAERSGE